MPIFDEVKISNQISDVVGCLADPIICFPGYEEDKPQKEYMEIITIQRLVENLTALHENRQPTGTDAEAAWYLSTTSLAAPLDHMWTEIYMYTFNKTMQDMKKEIPEDLKKEELSQYDMGHLRHLKRWLYEKRSAARKGMVRQERREEREAKKEQEAVLQPSLFDFTEVADAVDRD